MVLRGRQKPQRGQTLGNFLGSNQIKKILDELIGTVLHGFAMIKVGLFEVGKGFEGCGILVNLFILLFTHSAHHDNYNT